MSDEIRATYTENESLYAMIFNAAGQVWDTTSGPAAFEAFDDAQVANYDIAMVEQGDDSGEYRGDWPTMDAGVYSVQVWNAANPGNPVWADDTRVGITGTMYWDGSAEINHSIIDTVVDSILVDTGTTLDGKINTIDTNVDAILVDTGTTLPATLTTITGYVDTLETSATAIEAYVDTLEASATSIIGYVDTVEATLALIKAKTDLITTGQLTIVDSISSDDDMTIVQGDDYSAVNGNALSWTSTAWTSPDLTSATVALKFITKANYDVGTQDAALEVAGSISWAGAGEDAVFTAELTDVQTAALSSPTPPNDKYSYVYQLQVTLQTGEKTTVALGSVYVKQEITS